MKNDPIIHAKASKIVEAIMKATYPPQKLNPNYKKNYEVEQMRYRLKEAIASLGGEEKPIIRGLICAECGMAHSGTEVIMEDDGFNYSYYCKNCRALIESNGEYYGKIIVTTPQPSEREVLPHDIIELLKTIVRSDERIYRQRAMSLLDKYLAKKQSKTE